MKGKARRIIQTLMFVLALGLLASSVISVSAAEIPLNNTYFPDNNFLSVVKPFDKNKDGKLSQGEIDLVHTINCPKRGITNMTGIEHFTKLKVLKCANNLLGSLDLSSNTLLEHLECYNYGNYYFVPSPKDPSEKNHLTTLDLSNNTMLTYLNCADNQLTSLNLSSCDKLETLICNDNKLDSLNLSGNPLLTRLDCYNIGAHIRFPSPKDPSEKNHLTTLDLSGNPLLTYVNCADNQLTSLIVNNCGSLKTLYCHENKLSQLDLSGNGALIDLRCHDNKLDSLDLTNNIALTTLRCYNSDNGHDWYPSKKDPSEKNHLTTLNLQNNIALTYLNCADNQLETLDLSGNPNLVSFFCGWNKMKTLDFTYNTKLTGVSCVYNELKELDFTNNPLLAGLTCYYNNIETLTLGNQPNFTTLYGNNNKLTTIDFSGCPKLSVANFHCNNITTMDFSSNPLLTQILCYENPMTSLDVSSNGALKYLYCYDMGLTSLNVSSNPALELLYCYNNPLKSLDVTSNPALKWLACGDNQLASLDVGSNPNLLWLYCENNQLTSLDVSANGALTRLYCENNQLTALDVSNNPLLEHFYYHGNQLTALDLSNNGNITNDSSGDGNSDQIYRTSLVSVSANGIYQFDLSQVQGINLANVGTIKQENGNNLPATASYDNVSGLLEFDPAEKVLNVRYFYDLNHPVFPERKMEVIVALTYRYNVTYQDEHGNVIGVPQVVDHGSDAVPEAFPNKAGYNGAWNHDGKNITCDTLISPNYVIINFLVTYQDENGNVLGIPQVINYGAAATPEVIPYKIGYNGEWNHDGKNIMSNTVIRPIYTIIAFVVRYQDEEGNMVGSMQVVNYGCDAKPEPVPYKEGYTGRWDNDGRNVLRHLTIKPIYEIKSYNVVYQNDRGDTVGTPQTVNYGQDATPERIPDKEGYTGKWSHDGKNIKANTVIQALYTIKKYTVTYQDEYSKTIGLPQTVDHGSNAIPERVPEKEGYWGEWNSDGRNIVSDMVIKPLYTIKTYIVTYQDERENIIGIPQNVNHGSDVSRPEAVPPKAGYTGSWNHDGKNIISDTVIKPVYSNLTFVVTYQDEEGKTVGKPQTVAYGANAKPEPIPVREGFEVSWNHDGKNITSDTLIRLICKCEGKECPDCIVIYQDESGNVIGTPQEISPGSDAVPEAVPEKTGYTGKWNHDGKNITADTTIKPVYSADTTPGPSVRTPTFMTKIGEGKELYVGTLIVFLWIILLLLLTRRKKEEKKEETQ